jgi:NADH-quinone oxidoreductase subunit N
MSAQPVMSLLPMMILGGGMLITMILIALKRNHLSVLISSLVVLAISFGFLVCRFPEVPCSIGDLFIIDRFGLYFQALIIVATFVVLAFSYISLKNLFPQKRKEEQYLLVLLAALGSGMMVVSTHFISFFVSLEIITISLYSLVSYYRERSTAIEAGLKYMMLAAMSSAFLLFGMALIYAVSGAMSFSGIAAMNSALNTSQTVMMIAGVGMMITGIGFKLGVVPFHMWAPDVYEGASSPVSAFIATVSKGGVIAVLIRFFLMTNLYHFEKLILAFTIIAILSMLIGNLLGLMQNNVKRMLAYSSIANLGYVLVAFITGKEIGLHSATFYMTAYSIAILGAFGIITLVSQSDSEATDTEDYRSLFWRKPVLATAFTIFLLSLAGIPLTAGFMGKYLVLMAAIGNAHWLLAIVLVISSVIGLYYYLSLIVTMAKPSNDSLVNLSFPKNSIGGTILIVLLSFLVVWFGLWPAWLIRFIYNL